MPLPPGTRPTQAQSQEFDPIPEGVYHVEISDIKLEEKPKYKQPTESEQVYDFEFTILNEGEYRGRRLWTIARPFIVAGEKPSKLYLITSRTLRRLDLPEPEAIAFDPNELIGKQLQVTVIQKLGKNGKTYSNVSTFMAVTSNLDPVEKSEPAAVPPAASVVPQPHGEDEIDLEGIDFGPESA